MEFLAGKDNESIVETVISLTLFSPYGVGYAMSYEDAMELDSDVAERMIEAKNKVIDAMNRSHK